MGGEPGGKGLKCAAHFAEVGEFFGRRAQADVVFQAAAEVAGGIEVGIDLQGGGQEEPGIDAVADFFGVAVEEDFLLDFKLVFAMRLDGFFDHALSLFTPLCKRGGMLYHKRLLKPMSGMT